MKRWGLGLAILATLSISSSAWASIANGIMVNGTIGNGGPTNGTSVNGQPGNGTRINGGTGQGTRIEAATGLELVGAEVRGGELFL